MEFETTARHEATTALVVFKTHRNIGFHAHAGTCGAMLAHHDLASHDIRLGIVQVTRKPALYEKLVKSHGRPLGLIRCEHLGADAFRIESEHFEELVDRTLGHEGVGNTEAPDRTTLAHVGK